MPYFPRIMQGILGIRAGQIRFHRHLKQLATKLSLLGIHESNRLPRYSPEMVRSANRIAAGPKYQPSEYVWAESCARENAVKTLPESEPPLMG